MPAVAQGSELGRLQEMSLDGARLAYLEAGPAEAEPVLLLHGYPSNHRIWRHQVEALSGSHRVYAPDLLGWGASEQPLGLQFDYDTEVERLGRLLDGLGLERVNLIAHDYGGFLSLGFCQRHPERVARLALLNTRAQGSFVPRWYALFGGLCLIGRLPLLRSLAAALPLAAFHRRALAPLERKGVVDRELIESYLAPMRTRPGRRWLLHFFGEYGIAPRPELRDRLAEIGCPTAIVWGRRDQYIALETPLELAREIPGAELTLIDEAGHFVPEERPERVNRALLELLGR